MSKERLLSALSEKNLDNPRIIKIREDLNKLKHKFSKSEIKEIRKNLQDIKKLKNLSKSKIKETEKYLFELEESLSKRRKYVDNDDIENLFNQSTNEDYYKPIKTKNSFDNKNNYIEYESKGDKDKILFVKEYLDMIRPYLSDMINDHKTQGEWKIQLTMSIYFMSPKDSEETHTMYTKSHNVEIMTGSKTTKSLKNFLRLFRKNIKKD